MDTATQPKAQNVEVLKLTMDGIHIRIYEKKYCYVHATKAYMRVVAGAWAAFIPTPGIKKIIDDKFLTYRTREIKFAQQMKFMDENPGYLNNRKRQSAVMAGRSMTRGRQLCP